MVTYCFTATYSLLQVLPELLHIVLMRYNDVFVDSILFGDGEHTGAGAKQVLSIVGHQNWLAVAYCRCVCCYK